MPDSEAFSYEAAAAAINARFRRQLDGLYRRFQAWEIPAILRALQDDRAISLWLLQEHRAAEQFAMRQARKRRTLPRPPGP